MIWSVTKLQAEFVFCSISTNYLANGTEEASQRSDRNRREPEPEELRSPALGIWRDQRLQVILQRSSGSCILSRSPVNMKTKSTSDLEISTCSVIFKLFQKFCKSLSLHLRKCDCGRFSPPPLQLPPPHP